MTDKRDMLVQEGHFWITFSDLQYDKNNKSFYIKAIGGVVHV
ncbi:MAG: hypothetical protein WBL88_00735 [Nitrososphaeraceae archaeon]